MWSIRSYGRYAPVEHRYLRCFFCDGYRIGLQVWYLLYVKPQRQPEGGKLIREPGWVNFGSIKNCRYEVGVMLFGGCRRVWYLVTVV